MQLVLWPVHNPRLEIFMQSANALPRVNKYTQLCLMRLTFLIVQIKQAKVQFCFQEDFTFFFFLNIEGWKGCNVHFQPEQSRKQIIFHS